MSSSTASQAAAADPPRGWRRSLRKWHGGPDGRPRRESQGRIRRWLGRIAMGVVAVLILFTIFSVGYNQATAQRRPAPDGLGFVDAAGVSTRYLQWGTAGSAVILVHGAAESADTWNRVGPLLARNHRVYAYDIVGWGYTQRTGRYSVDDEVRQLLGFIAALGLDRPILVGHSSGAAAVALAALREPSQVGAVMFLDGDALSTGAGAHSPTSALIVDPYRTTLIRLVLGSDGLIRSIYDRQCGPTCPVLDAAGVDVWRRPMEVPGAERALWSMLALGVPGLPQSRLAALALLPLPKAVVFGADDAVFSPDTAITTAARIGAPAPTVITGGRHLTLISHPAEVGAAVEALAARR